ncbi:MAG TPA: ABC-type transport auxiliary lipoprotein family protein [Kiloniellales bacterium]|nr:ABC-type transport auxiliary lipoprotein family protein [Kiloniellales bacterium]
MNRRNSNARGGLTRRGLLLGALGLAPAATLAGCSELIPGQGPPPQLFRLTPKSTFADDLPTVEWQLVLAQPDADASLDTTRIALMREPTRIEYYAASGWTDRAPFMIQTLMLESFENSGKIVAVGRRAVGLRADFELRSELREFQAEYFTGAIEAHVAIACKLVRAAERAIVGSTSFDVRAPAGEDAMPAIIQAFDDALGAVLKQMVDWVLKTGEANYKPT